MIDTQDIFNKIQDLDKKLGPLGSKIDQFGMSTVIVSSYTIPVIVVDQIGKLVPIEIRFNKDTLGWLYDKADRFIILRGEPGTLKLKQLVKEVEAGVKANKKVEVSEPAEFKLLRLGESIWTFIAVDRLKAMLC